MAAHSTSMVFIQYLTTVFDNIKDAVLFIGVERNHTYRLLMANEAFYKDSGHTPDQAGMTIQDIVAPGVYKNLVKRYEQVIKTKKPYEYIATYDVPAGQRIFEVQLIPIINAVGEVVQIAGITRNITELHNLRELAKASAETLEQLARDLREA
jgi:PAS domain S-box-containing protein